LIAGRLPTNKKYPQVTAGIFSDALDYVHSPTAEAFVHLLGLAYHALIERGMVRPAPTLTNASSLACERFLPRLGGMGAQHHFRKRDTSSETPAFKYCCFVDDQRSGAHS
jgi:hypothetical protein